ncbi:hypothetical protein B0H63DRAFT_544332 [Podospora didyma]|uniref:NACHT-NTPase and P-loop NTPases N-terminal domain-containing protein n=1 Tax=Podospora didyma TaxID=330526 RepID=A0AAE0NQI2_9PEZI|nr:hypothetical protein B0H63DRAFT_544332 [Podospora didyma]
MATLGFPEILTIIGLVGQVVGSADRVAEIFGSIQNTPKQLRRLHLSIRQLQRNFDELRQACQLQWQLENGQQSPGDMDGCPVSSFMDSETIKSTLENGRILYSDCQATLRQGPWRNVILTIRRSRQINEYQKEIEHLQSCFFQPVWSQLTYARLVALSAHRVSMPAIPIPAIEIEMLAAKAMHQPAAELAVPGNAQGVRVHELPVPAPQLHESFRTIFGLAVHDHPELAIPVEWSHIPLEPLQVTIHLEAPNVPEYHQTLELTEVHIMFRTPTIRILHFRDRAGTTRVKHVLPIGKTSIAWTSTRESHSATTRNSHWATFYGKHYITIIDTEGEHHLYSVDKPRYSFPRSNVRRRFQDIARERTLVAEFMAVSVTASRLSTGDKSVAQSEVVRLWRRERGWLELSHVTMSVLASSLHDGKTHEEWDLHEFAHTARHCVEGVFRRPSRSVELRCLSISSKLGSLTIRLESVQGEQNFAEFIILAPASAFINPK